MRLKITVVVLLFCVCLGLIMWDSHREAQRINAEWERSEQQTDRSIAEMERWQEWVDQLRELMEARPKGYLY